MSHPDGLALHGPNGAERGYVDFRRTDGRPALEDLWIFQGSLCDLKCKHCYTASSPAADHLGQVGFHELRPHLDDARRFGVRKIWFTGGEVFVNREVLSGRAARNEEFLGSLAYALEIAPVEVLTNGRKHIRTHFDALADLRRRHGDRLTLRITLESPEAAGHDRIRGRGTFAQTLDTLARLCELGFLPVVTTERPLLGGLSDEEIRAAYGALFASRGISAEINPIENMLEMGHELVRIEAAGRAQSPEVFVTTGCFALLGKSPDSLMCAASRTIQKIDGELRVYPCPVICADARFELGRTLEESFRRVYLAHKNCYDYCLRGVGATCRTRAL
jgi:MoaA/NifB/PqqE/SkfB family radical SAM enzyme